ncbi:MAG: cation transporter [Phycisphaerae bacterium]|nr:cation transporter [Phycisphaerae bacterium]
MPRSVAMRATKVAIAANLFLLALKASATSLSDSLTIFSETLNSLADVVSSVVVLLCVRWAWMRPDEDHPFGHRRAEPIAGLVVAIFTGILGFEVCKTAVVNLVQGRLPERIGLYPIVALCITACLKAGLAVYFHRRGRFLGSPALRATAIDCRNDVFVAMQGLVAVVVAELRLPLLDTVAALFVGVYILYSGHRIGMENIDYLMGRSPGAGLLDRIRTAARDVPGVVSVGDVKGHHVGTFVHVELTARVDGDLSTTASHGVCESVRETVEAIEAVDRAFIHISPARRAGDVPAGPADPEKTPGP